MAWTHSLTTHQRTSVPSPTSLSARRSARRRMRRSLSRPSRSRRTLLFPYVAPYKTTFYHITTCLHTIQAKSHGNEPSKGAKIDQELAEEDAAALKGKGSFGPQ